MRVPGMIRKVDDLGRVVIPGELRRAMGLRSGEQVEMQLQNGVLLLRRFGESCVFCFGTDDLVTYEGKHICSTCLQNLRKV